MEQVEEKPVKQSRWVKKSDVPRYTKEQQKALDAVPCDADGWSNGARVRKVES